jgi:hypothetical protein
MRDRDGDPNKQPQECTVKQGGRATACPHIKELVLVNSGGCKLCRPTGGCLAMTERDDFVEALVFALRGALDDWRSWEQHERAVLAVARVALARAASHLRAEAAERIASLKTTMDRDTSHLVIGLLRSMADDVEAMLPKAET